MIGSIQLNGSGFVCKHDDLVFGRFVDLKPWHFHGFGITGDDCYLKAEN
jgi:hypothetical protein